MANPADAVVAPPCETAVERAERLDSYLLALRREAARLEAEDPPDGAGPPAAPMAGSGLEVAASGGGAEAAGCGGRGGGQACGGVEACAGSGCAAPLQPPGHGHGDGHGYGYGHGHGLRGAEEVEAALRTERRRAALEAQRRAPRRASSAREAAPGGEPHRTVEPPEAEPEAEVGAAARRLWMPAPTDEAGPTPEEECWLRAHAEASGGDDFCSEYDEGALSRRKLRLRLEALRAERAAQAAATQAAAEAARAGEAESAAAAAAAAVQVDPVAGGTVVDELSKTTSSSTAAEDEELLDSLLSDVRRGGFY